MKLVSQNTERDLCRLRAEAEVQSALKSLAVNILRVTRGAGRPEQLGRQAQDFVESLISYKDADGIYPSSHLLTATLSLRPDAEFMQRLSIENQREEDAKETIIRGALQIAASKLCHQLTIERAGDSEMYDGIQQIEGLRAERRKAIAQSSREPKRKISLRAKQKPKSDITL